MDVKAGVGSPNTIQQWKKEQEQEQEIKKPVIQKVGRAFIIQVALIAFVVYFFFTIGTWVMIDMYHKNTLKRVIRVEKKLDAANKQIKWLRQAFGVTVKGRVKEGSRLDKLVK